MVRDNEVCVCVISPADCSCGCAGGGGGQALWQPPAELEGRRRTIRIGLVSHVTLSLSLSSRVFNVNKQCEQVIHFVSHLL